MAPRSAKAKKAAEVKATENEVSKKGRGKGKIVEVENEELDTEVSEKVAPVAEKKKRGKKANDNDQENKVEESAPPAKRGRKKNVPDVEEKVSNVDEDSADEVLSAPAEEDTEANGHNEEAQGSTGRGRKKQAKKEPAPEKTEPKSGRSRRKQEVIDYDESPKDEVDEKPKAAGKGRGRPKAQPKVQSPENEDVADEEEVKEKPSTKGRKKATGKAKPEKEEKSDESDKEEEDDKEPEEKPKKKEPKGRKNQGKKAPPKDEDEADIEEEKDLEEEKDASSSKRRKGAKAEAEPKDEEDIDDEALDTKPGKGKKVPKKAAEASTETDEEPQDTGEPTTKRRRKVAEEKGPIEENKKKPASVEDGKKKPPTKNKSVTNYEDLDFSNSSKSGNGKEWNFKISSWNVDGIRAWSSKGGLDYLKYEKPDILCLQETKCAQDKLPDEVSNPPGYHAYWLAGEKDGYAGVGIYTTKLAMNVQYGLQNEELDKEGRIITAEYEHFYLICTYVPNSGRKLVTLPKRLQWNEEFRKYVKVLDKKKPVIICGDMNVSHNEMDLANPKTNRKNAGFTDEERTGLTEFLGDGFVDTFRHLNPDKTGAYTFWTYMSNSRAKNVGWRLDYFIVSERLLPFLCDSSIRDQVYGSDHCPISLFLHLSTADKPKE